MDKPTPTQSTQAAEPAAHTAMSDRQFSSAKHWEEAARGTGYFGAAGSSRGRLVAHGMLAAAAGA